MESEKGNVKSFCQKMTSFTLQVMMMCHTIGLHNIEWKRKVKKENVNSFCQKLSSFTLQVMRMCHNRSAPQLWDRWRIGLHNIEWKWKVKREFKETVLGIFGKNITFQPILSCDRWTIGLHNKEWKWKVKGEFRDIVLGVSIQNLGIGMIDEKMKAKMTSG